MSGDQDDAEPAEIHEAVFHGARSTYCEISNDLAEPGTFDIHLGNGRLALDNEKGAAFIEAIADAAEATFGPDAAVLPPTWIYTVQTNGRYFPLDMLRYDRSWFVEEEEALKLADALLNRIPLPPVVTLMSKTWKGPDVRRWRSFNATVTSIKRNGVPVQLEGAP